MAVGHAQKEDHRHYGNEPTRKAAIREVTGARAWLERR